MKHEFWLGYGKKDARDFAALRGELALVYSHFADHPRLIEQFGHGLHVFEYANDGRLPFLIMDEVCGALGWPGAVNFALSEIKSPGGSSFGHGTVTAPTVAQAEADMAEINRALKTIGEKFTFISKQGIERGEIERFEASTFLGVLPPSATNQMGAA